MSVVDLAIPYGVVGACGAVLSLVAGERRSVADAFLLLVVWPVYAPFVLTRGAGSSSLPGAAPGGAEHPLVAVLPDRATLAAVERRLGVARERIADIARLLARPELCEARARARVEALERAAASAEAIAGARSRLASIERLRLLQDRFQREIEQVGEALIELETQAELVRLVGAEDPAMADVLRELGARSESLSLMLAEEIPASPPEPEATDRP
ncbi:MAG TPA: hypothetical protein VFU21_18615 [Kofleriaceae bacterium]|nr:hypothetical protein [Kofleriaceae bacterium]